MEKLIELLNEYEKEIKKSEFYEWEKGIGGDTNLFRRDTRDEEGSHLYSDTADTYVISKKFGFIKWLVEDEKIDRKKYDRVYINTKESGILGLKDYEQLIMLLSISEKPIEFLISVLK